MNFASIQDRIRPAGNSTLHALIPVVTVLISGLVIILAVSPEYLMELHPLTLLLLAIACALPVWAWSQVLWWYTGRSISGAIVAKVTYILDVPEKRKTAYALALSELLKAVDILRFVPHENIANFVTVITIYVGAALCYLAGASPDQSPSRAYGEGVVVQGGAAPGGLRRRLGLTRRPPDRNESCDHDRREPDISNRPPPHAHRS